MAGFAEVIYSQETQYHRTGGANNHLHIGWPAGWSRGQVAAHARKIAGQFNIRVGGQCRANNVRPPGGAEDSLHYVKNGCRAVDFTGSDANLLKAEAWARSVSDMGAMPTDVAMPGVGEDIMPLLKEIGLGVAAFLGGVTALGLGIYMIAKDQGVDIIFTPATFGRL